MEGTRKNKEESSTPNRATSTPPSNPKEEQKPNPTRPERKETTENPPRKGAPPFFRKGKRGRTEKIKKEGKGENNNGNKGG